GIGGCFSVGSNAAKSLAAPTFSSEHYAHESISASTCLDSSAQFPFLTLLIFGGHTLLLLASSLTSFQILATTADTTTGRAFDKAARALGLSLGTRGPGATLEELCRVTNDELEFLPDIQPFTVPMSGKLAFSFASLQSSVDRYISLMEEPLPSSHKIASARAFQTAAARQLCAKLTLSLQKLELKG
ncbi:hypothetical protein EDD22DRAFT_736111, partial [Suillus occidentalis]